MPAITNTIDIKAAPEDVWAVLTDFPGTSKWLPGIISARMEGTLRVCATADGQEIHEQISDISPERRSFRFQHVRVPLPVQHSGGTFTVTAGPAADTATVTLHTEFEPLDPTAGEQLTGMIRSAFGQSLESLRRFIEEKVNWDGS